MTGNLLRVVVEAARASALGRERSIDRARFDREVDGRTPQAGAFARTLVEPGIRVIAECKRRSPSRGVLRREYDAPGIAAAYAQAGAAAISVLTEPSFFDGSLDDLRAVRQVTGLPLLRKDFIVTGFQVAEARAAGADAVLLIVAALDDRALADLLRLSTEIGLAALVEVHDREELGRALDAGASIVGVNSRDLRTLDVNPEVFETVLPWIPSGVTAVAESGLRTASDVSSLRERGYHAFLIGERFVTETDPGAALHRLRAAAAGDTGE
jgi:indole-3-glycerol phosphate synthase